MGSVGGGSPEGAGRRAARAARRLFAVALAVRIAFLLAYDSPGAARGKDAWSWGYEAACVARSVAEGEGFASPWRRAVPPWDVASGPTGWLPPAYPALLALLMKLFGGVSTATAAALLVVQCVLSAATCVLVARLGRALGEPRAGALAGWILCFDPVSVWNAAYTVWDTTLVAFALTAFLLLAFRAGRDPTPRAAALLGLGFGALMMVNPAPATIAPVLAAWWCFGRGRLARGARATLAFGAAALVACLPWIARNQRELGAATLRTNLGVEAMVGNNDRADGYFQGPLHPSYDPARFRRYLEVGEVAYAREALAEARAWALADPVRFVALSLRRARIFWFGDWPPSDPRREAGLAPADDPKSWVKWATHLASGLACLAGAVVLARRRVEGRALLAILALFPLPYYLTHFLERYRFPIEPVVVLLAAVALLAVVDRLRRARAGADVERPAALA